MNTDRYHFIFHEKNVTRLHVHALWQEYSESKSECKFSLNFSCGKLFFGHESETQN